MKKVRKKLQGYLRLLPAWVFTALVTAAVLWLTLAPEPIGHGNMPPIPGLDKFAHFMMFGGLQVAVCTDLWLTHRLSLRTMLIAACLVSLFGGGIELLQGWMPYGRGAQLSDWVADIAGAFFWGWLVERFYR